jgi:catechol 2,3-dioxygenase-like lactoylglutathione lyase family enzyme
MMSAPELLGVDNAMFSVADLDESIAFYKACGMVLKFRVDPPGMALFGIGPETPGLMLMKGGTGTGRLWLEVADADKTAATLKSAGIVTTRIETKVGITVEARDPSGNVLGFADYTKRPEMGRKLKAPSGYESP